MQRLALLVLLVTGCTDDTTSSSTTEKFRCPSLENRMFESVDIQPDCGLGPTGPVPCNWTIYFDGFVNDRTAFHYRYSDIGESGDVQCDGASVTEIGSAFGTPHAGTYDAATDRLTWDGIEYQPYQ
jgi:hypothetical protein